MSYGDSGSSKFQSLLKKIQQVIKADGLKAGDRLPSERELSERLHAGRSSVREVLRSLELLGLIVTKRGEGTFLQPAHTHHLVELLAKYILQDNRSIADLWEVRILLELGAVWLLCERSNEEDLKCLIEENDRMRNLETPIEISKADNRFHERLIHLTKNELLNRIWYPIMGYIETNEVSCLFTQKDAQKLMEEHQKLIESIGEQNIGQAMKLLKDHFPSKA